MWISKIIHGIQDIDKSSTLFYIESSSISEVSNTICLGANIDTKLTCKHIDNIVGKLSLVAKTHNMFSSEALIT